MWDGQTQHNQVLRSLEAVFPQPFLGCWDSKCYCSACVHTPSQELTSPVAAIRNNFQIYMMSFISQCAHTVHSEKKFFFTNWTCFLQCNYISSCRQNTLHCLWSCKITASLWIHLFAVIKCAWLIPACCWGDRYNTGTLALWQAIKIPRCLAMYEYFHTVRPLSLACCWHGSLLNQLHEMRLTGVIMYFYGDYVWPVIETNMPVTVHSFSSHLLSEVLELARHLQGKEM